MYDFLFVSRLPRKQDKPGVEKDFGNFNISHVQLILDILKERGYSVGVEYSPTTPIPAKAYLYTNCIAITDFPWMSKYGKRCYQSHGAGLFKDYAYNRGQHKHHDHILMMGQGFVDKYNAQFPGHLTPDKYKIIGYSKYDYYKNQFNQKTSCRDRLVSKWKLDPTKPIIVFAPTWGPWSEQFRFLDKLDNIIFLPRSGSMKGGLKRILFSYEKSLELMGADIIISDISSLSTEVTRAGKKVIQLAIRPYEFTHMKKADDLVIPQLAHMGPFEVGRLIKETDPFLDLKFWQDKIEEALSLPILPSAQKWAEYSLAFDDNRNSERGADYLCSII